MTDHSADTAAAAVTDALAATDGAAAAAAPAKQGKARLRTVFAVLFGILAVLGIFASTLAIWAQNALFDKETFTDAADKALQQPATIDELSSYVTDQVFTSFDVQKAVHDALPANLQQLSPAVAGGARSFLESALGRVLAADQTRHLIVGIVGETHDRLVQVLEGKGKTNGITVADDTVTVNLLPLVGVGLTKAQDLGLFGHATIPDLSAGGDPTQQIAELSTVLGRDLPPDLGQLVVYQGSEVNQAAETVHLAQRTVVLVKRAIWLVLAITVIAVVGCILVANRRRRAILVLALASAAVMLVARKVLTEVVARTPNLVINPGARAGLASAVRSLAGGLLTVMTVLLVIGLIAATVAYFSGDSAFATSTRERFNSGRGSVGAITATHREATALVLFAVAVLTLGIFGVGVLAIIVAAVLLVVGLWFYLAAQRAKSSVEASAA